MGRFVDFSFWFQCFSITARLSAYFKTIRKIPVLQSVMCSYDPFGLRLRFYEFYLLSLLIGYNGKEQPGQMLKYLLGVKNCFQSA